MYLFLVLQLLWWLLAGYSWESIVEYTGRLSFSTISILQKLPSSHFYAHKREERFPLKLIDLCLKGPKDRKTQHHMDKRKRNMNPSHMSSPCIIEFKSCFNSKLDRHKKLGNTSWLLISNILWNRAEKALCLGR